MFPTCRFYYYYNLPSNLTLIRFRFYPYIFVFVSIYISFFILIGNLPMTPSNLIVFAIFVILLNPIPTQVDGQKEQSDIIEALLTLQKALGGKTNTWDRSTAPCSWKGIRCVEGEVTEIRLPGGSLIGVIPNGVFGSLSSLRALSIHDNAIVGPLPSDLASCVQLRYLYLHRNGFEGDISVLGSLKKLINLDISQNKFSSDDVSTIGSLRDLANLDLGSNEFSGRIPESFSELQNLRSLLLENNDFSGVIPDLDLRNLKSFNVSYNNLTGSVPNKLRSFPETSFLGMSSLCGGSLQPCEDEKEKKKDKLSIKQLLGIIIPCIIFLLILLFLLLFCCLRRRRASQAKETDLEASSATTTAARRSVNSNASTGSASSKVLVFFDPDPTKKFDLEELLRASAEVLGKGTFGTTYKALLEQGFTVAVKRLRSVDVSDATAFRSKIESLGKMVHPNLVPLRAFYNGREETLFIYDFMYVGSLSARLHGINNIINPNYLFFHIHVLYK